MNVTQDQDLDSQDQDRDLDDQDRDIDDQDRDLGSQDQDFQKTNSSALEAKTLVSRTTSLVNSVFVDIREKKIRPLCIQIYIQIC